MTVDAEKFQKMVRALGCIVCLTEGLGRSPCDIHHILRGGKRIDELHVLGLCAPHHRSGVNSAVCVSRHPWHRAFERRYGTEASLLQKTRELLKWSS